VFIYPRFFSGLSLLAAVVRGVTWAARNSCPAFVPFADFAAASSFESFIAFNAALAFLLSLFFSFGIDPLVRFMKSAD